MVKGLRYGLACLFLIGCDRFQGEQELLIADELETIAIRSSSDAVAKIPAASFELQPKSKQVAMSRRRLRAIRRGRSLGRGKE